MKTKIQTTTYILTGIIFFLCALSIIFLLFYPKKNVSYCAHIYVNGTLYDTIPLQDITSAYSIRITTEDGHYNDLYIKSGSICISAADCPDLICVKQGPITNNLLPITCLPHNLVIELKPTDVTLDIPDATTH